MSITTPLRVPQFRPVVFKSVLVTVQNLVEIEPLRPRTEEYDGGGTDTGVQSPTVPFSVA
jgi:hypothetical protein